MKEKIYKVFILFFIILCFVAGTEAEASGKSARKKEKSCWATYCGCCGGSDTGNDSDDEESARDPLLDPTNPTAQAQYQATGTDAIRTSGAAHRATSSAASAQAVLSPSEKTPPPPSVPAPTKLKPDEQFFKDLDSIISSASDLKVEKSSLSSQSEAKADASSPDAARTLTIFASIHKKRETYQNDWDQLSRSPIFINGFFNKIFGGKGIPKDKTMPVIRALDKLGQDQRQFANPMIVRLIVTQVKFGNRDQADTLATMKALYHTGQSLGRSNLKNPFDHLKTWVFQRSLWQRAEANAHIKHQMVAYTIASMGIRNTAKMPLDERWFGAIPPRVRTIVQQGQVLPLIKKIGKYDSEFETANS